MARSLKNTGPKGEKFWRHTLNRVLNERAEHPDSHKPVKKLYLVARSVVDAAIAGDMAAAKEIGDRLDGKPLQPLDQHITIGPDESFIDFIRELSARRLAQQSEAGVIDVRAEDTPSPTRALASPSPEGD